MIVQGNRLSRFWSACRSGIPAVVFLAAACGDGGTEPDTLSLVGTWDWVGFSDAGVAAVCTGTVVFRTDHTLSFNGTITWPEETTDPAVEDGSYSQSGNSLTMTFDGETSTWLITEQGEQITLTGDGPAPATTITLRSQ